LKANYDVTKLPKWAQLEMNKMSQTLIDLANKLHRLQTANFILDNMDYFTLNTGRAKDDRDDRMFYTVVGNEIRHIATCGPDDIILIGRSKKEYEK